MQKETEAWPGTGSPTGGGGRVGGGCHPRNERERVLRQTRGRYS